MFSLFRLYAYAQKSLCIGRRPARKVGKRHMIRGATTRVTRNADGWQPWMGTASYCAADEAKADAVELVQELKRKGTVAALKEMSDSQVSGGFWCQLPRPFSNTFEMTKRWGSS
jgi:hypothetical protein